MVLEVNTHNYHTSFGECCWTCCWRHFETVCLQVCLTLYSKCSPHASKHIPSRVVFPIHQDDISDLVYDSSVGIRWGTDAHIHTDGRDHYKFCCQLRITRNVKMAVHQNNQGKLRIIANPSVYNQLGYVIWLMDISFLIKTMKVWLKLLHIWH